MENTTQAEWRNLLNGISEKESIEIKANLLALQFLGLVDEALKERHITKKELADQIGTTVSYLTLLFRGVRKPSWKILAKMSVSLGLDFKINLVVNSPIKTAS